MHVDDRQILSLALQLIGSVAAGTAAYPWFSYALAANRGDDHS